MKRAVLVGCFALVLAGCGKLATPPSGGDARRGAQLFAGEGCVQCHMVNKVGGTTGPDLTQDLAAANYDLLSYYLSHPPSGMEVVRGLHLSPGQIADLNAFVVSSVKPVQSTATPTAVPPTAMPLPRTGTPVARSVGTPPVVAGTPPAAGPTVTPYHR